ncbi:dTDP-4-dehydrorhamnose reductase [Burkholderia sp. MS389]|uniref:dTDP-4-dehydrorhamnose reductase n=1 Tax=Burkholderia TaxID=32008 RepID=UPI000F5999F3|nr:dTDP-4-dehydrorhamnose reductase [Burkholderia sp. AcTa6-5]QRR12675.1 dTDP-4-dehydrorhamnose reductase [Burkholderia sp. MS389]RQV23121.1 dTDP-4-dehydrorhamnose reductase [Burkholderia cenocepacia]RQV74466.1 dTDP-4-dehydrorhamnose reductase [Burkholderia cenocepacia]
MRGTVDRPTIVVTGVSGQVGFELQRTLQCLGRVVSCDRAALDLSDLARVREFIRTTAPSIIVNPAAYTAVDRAETDEVMAMRINAELPATLAQEAAALGAVLVHYSTDYVFDGQKSGPYVEDDQPNPQNIYGKSKLAGELSVAAAGCAHLILRTSWVYGRRGKNFLRTMQRLATERRELKVVADQIGAPTWSRTIAEATAQILSQGIAANRSEWWRERSGVYHLTAAGETSWCGFAKSILERDGHHADTVVVPITSSEYPTPAARPSNSRMSIDKISKIFGLHMPAWDEALGLCLGD